MSISCTRQEALDKLRATLSAKPIVTLFVTMFPESTLVAHQASQLREALAQFEEYWTGAGGINVQVFAYNAVDLFGRTAAEWRIDLLRAKDSAE